VEALSGWKLVSANCAHKLLCRVCLLYESVCKRVLDVSYVASGKES